jgi:hypothetical protein
MRSNKKKHVQKTTNFNTQHTWQSFASIQNSSNCTVENKQLHSPGLIMAEEKRKKHSRSKIPQGPSPPSFSLGNAALFNKK